MMSAIRRWRTKRFMASLAPIVTKRDGGDWILDEFRKQRGREFNPFNGEDRHDVDMAVRLAIIKAWDVRQVIKP